ncbi:MAG: nucleotide exchange factor GrpE [Nitrospirae bacterium CG_4_10_14_3_um_filter_44_29]|nr:nucleotide exchange factor GrpE [Nitrospirota bacterium]OIO32050.1 MAG: nucleotide exchange factor GrpE [Nitrospirae bacterium CG1_02_44_142]PIP70720.1 MAG: nucleotide exchange factor GrpE [Nitrospirae bacterium CG22_combo_CG10-13_8_21_14_all_44_11]PIV41718.1 MAG: nucleotide exchange factor GrpE [Nitrospirae bacterium CG02_land_8_20_14_3_00_44_33]PIV65402.1 MAG: nucleotide exchange factor GrpE [Nitrospirae bacterium CG01_land_8_20_14_3_00_44_22]PIW89097.1 MAG: nucleotide exchange factor Grp
MKHKDKKKTNEALTEENSSAEAHEPELQAAEEAAGSIAAGAAENAAAADAEAGNLKANLEEELQQENDKYLRLYAEFENYKKRVARDKEELIKYGNEALLYELLPVIDNLEMAVKHSSNDASSASGGGLAQGVEITLKEFFRVIDKFGLSPIEASGKMFDPSLHHAMTQVERDDIDENMVVEEFRKGYMLREKVLRPSLVAVSKKTVRSDSVGEETLTLNTDTK